VRGPLRPGGVLAALGLIATIATAAATVVLSGAATTAGARTPVTGTVAAGRSESPARPALAVTPAPPPAGPVAGTADPSALFVLYATSLQGAGPAHVVRLSRQGQVLASGGVLPDGSDLVRAGDSLWVAGGAVPAVFRLDPTRLLLRQRVDLPVPARTIAATATAVWVGGPGRLARTPPRSGALTAAVPVDGEPTSLAADPAGRRLYAAATTPQGTVVTERDARSGRLLASRRLAPGTGHVAAVAGGVWVWQEDAAPPAMVRLHPGDLRPAATAPAPRAPWVTGSLLWVADRTTLSCADPLTGRVRATWAVPPPVRVLAADPSRIALLAAGRVVVFSADPRCG
jgi:hypothetical protein